MALAAPHRRPIRRRHRRAMPCHSPDIPAPQAPYWAALDTTTAATVSAAPPPQRPAYTNAPRGPPRAPHMVSGAAPIRGTSRRASSRHVAITRDSRQSRALDHHHAPGHTRHRATFSTPSRAPMRGRTPTATHGTRNHRYRVTVLSVTRPKTPSRRQPLECLSNRIWTLSRSTRLLCTAFKSPSWAKKRNTPERRREVNNPGAPTLQSFLIAKLGENSKPLALPVTSPVRYRHERTNKRRHPYRHEKQRSPRHQPVLPRPSRHHRRQTWHLARPRAMGQRHPNMRTHEHPHHRPKG